MLLTARMAQEHIILGPFMFFEIKKETESPDAACVQGCLIAAGIGVMLLQRDGKIMESAEVLACAHI